MKNTASCPQVYEGFASPSVHTSPVSYGLAEEAWFGYPDLVRDLVERRSAKRVADIGGGANPVLDAAYITEHQIKYTMIDIDGSELAKAPDCYDKLEGDVTSGTCGDDQSYDLVFSAMLAEHVRSGEALHRNLFRLLAPGGVAIHYFPTMFCPPFVANYFLPERFATWCLNLFNPRDRFQNAKFPAHYSWCRGPSVGQLARLREIGYEVDLYRGFFGHIYYKKIPLLRTLSRTFAKYLVKNPQPHLTSFAWLVLRKPLHPRQSESAFGN